MYNISLIRNLLASAALVTFAAGCKKDNKVETPPSLAHFNNKTEQTYYIQNDPNSVYNLQVGSTTVSSTDRTLTYTVSSPTGAAAGAQYSIVNSGTVVIPAGQAVGIIPVKGIFAGFPGNRVGTLLFTITGGDSPASAYNSVTKLVLKKYCEVSVASLSGDYDNSFDYSGSSTPDYGPYSMTISDINPGSTGTRDTIRIDNFWDYGNPIRVALDWTDPSNFKTTVIDGAFIYNDPTYGPITIKARGNGTFSSCDQKFTINFSLAASVGTFSNPFTTILSR